MQQNVGYVYELSRLGREGPGVYMDSSFPVEFGQLSLNKPTVEEVDGAMTSLTPNQARLRNLTYSSPVMLGRRKGLTWLLASFWGGGRGIRLMHCRKH